MVCSSADVHVRCLVFLIVRLPDRAEDPPRNQDLEIEVGKLILIGQADPVLRDASK